MSAHKKNSISYMIPADNGSNSDNDDHRHSHNRKQKEQKGHSDNRAHMNPYRQMSSMMNPMALDPFGMSNDFRRSGLNMFFGLPNMNDMFNMFQMSSNDPNCHSFSSSTIMTMSSGPDGRPQVYQASHSTRTAPGGVCETKKAVCDSRTGTKKLAIGHHIGDRSHIMEREQNLHSGQQEERQEFINLDEDEADDFNQEWERKLHRGGGNAIGYGQPRAHSRRQREDIPAILDRYRTRSRITPRRYYPAITSSSSSERTTEKGKKRSQKNELSDEDVGGKRSHKFIKSSHKKKL